jgi:hypothetical protein
MKLHALSIAGVLACGSFLYAQGQRYPGPDLSLNSSYRVVSTGKHTGTQRNYPWPPVQPPGYATSPGVVAGTRSWQYTPPPRVTGGSQFGPWMTVIGMSQAIHVGAAVTTFPAPNHYQFETGIAPTVATASPPQKTHAPSGADVLNVATAPLALTTGNIYEHVFNLTTPIPLPTAVDLCLFVVFRGGEWQDDVNGGQTTGCDWRGAWFTPQGLPFSGFATPTQPRTITFTGDKPYLPKIGLQIAEPVFCITGDHGNGYYAPRLVNELYRGISAAFPDYGSAMAGTLFFDVSAGTAYSAGGSAIVLLNVGTNFPGSIPFPPAGNLLLNPADPSFGLLAGIVLGLGPLGDYSGEATPFPVPALGAGAVGTHITGQALVFNPGFAQAKLSVKSGMIVNQ